MVVVFDVFGIKGFIIVNIIVVVVVVFRKFSVVIYKIRPWFVVNLRNYAYDCEKIWLIHDLIH